MDRKILQTSTSGSFQMKNCNQFFSKTKMDRKILQISTSGSFPLKSWTDFFSKTKMEWRTLQTWTSGSFQLKYWTGKYFRIKRWTKNSCRLQLLDVFDWNFDLKNTSGSKTGQENPADFTFCGSFQLKYWTKKLNAKMDKKIRQTSTSGSF